MIEFAPIKTDNSLNKASFPKNRPICCNRKMYPAGGDIGKIVNGSIRYWRFDRCEQQCKDIAS